MKQLLTLIAATLLTWTANAGEPEPFRFNASGEFTVMQLTDLHYNAAEVHSAHIPPMLEKMILAERPDLIIVTGDLIYSRPGDVLMREICGILARQGVPYAVTLGNHDAEQGVSQAELHELLRTLPGCVNGRYDTGKEASGDFVIPVLSADGTREEARLYVMDSNDYNTDDHSYKGFTAEQVAWYTSRSSEAEARNGYKANGLLFFHIPLPEYAEAYNTAPVTGFRIERECPPRDNTGMFSALVEQGEVTGCFAGHDHSNNYVAEKEGIALAYGRYSGGFAEYQELLSGARIIHLTEGKRGFTTWERLANGRRNREVTFPRQSE